MPQHPDSHVRVITTVLPKLGSRWVDPEGDLVTVFEVSGMVKYRMRGGSGAAAVGYFISRFTPVVEGT